MRKNSKIIVLTSPTPIQDETTLCNTLFARGLTCLHLRKPGASVETYEQFIRQIRPDYRERIVLHEHYELVEKYQLRGIHVKYAEACHYHSRCRNYTVSVSCHSVEELQKLPFRPDYCFLSPIFDSISKKGYASRFPQLPDLSGIDFPVYALGGIVPEQIPLCRQAGFEGVAVLGYIWEKPAAAVEKFLRLQTPPVISIAGFDPSSGAGVSADLKTFEATGSYGLGVCSALTFQNDSTFNSVHWISMEEIQQQCDLLFDKYPVEYVKIGLIESFDHLDRLLDYLLTKKQTLKIVWDPILKASTGFLFHGDTDVNRQELGRLLDRLYLITPNTEELRQLFGPKVCPEQLANICRQHQVNILWKGGHNEGKLCTDILFHDNRQDSFSIYRSHYSKHGTGCILSAALISFLAQGEEVTTSCNKAQLYVSRVINSNDSLLGYHYIGSATSSAKPTPNRLPLQYITDPKTGMTLCEQVEAVCRGGMRWIQLRMKKATTDEILQEGQKIKEICRRYNALFIVNDRVDIARTLEADGVHLGKEDMDPRDARQILGPDKIIGATCNTWQDILLRQQQQVDYIGLGPYTFTTTKEKLSPILGLEGYRKLLRKMQETQIRIPVFAIGGICEPDIPSLMETGIQGIALSGLIKNSADLRLKTMEILTLLNS